MLHNVQEAAIQTVTKSASIRTQVYVDGNVLDPSHHPVHCIVPVNERRLFGFAEHDLA